MEKAKFEELPKKCLEAAEILEQLANEFDRLGWERHAGLIRELECNLRIYFHQVKSWSSDND